MPKRKTANAWNARPDNAKADLTRRNGDERELKEAIDFPSVRESLKSQLSAQMALQVADAQEKGGFEALGAALAMGMVGPMIDGLVTPQFIAGNMAKPVHLVIGSWSCGRND